MMAKMTFIQLFRRFLYRILTIFMSFATIIIGGSIIFNTKVSPKKLNKMENVDAYVSVIPASMSAIFSDATYVEYNYNGTDYGGSIIPDHPVAAEETITIKVDPNNPEKICSIDGKMIKSVKDYFIGFIIILVIIIAEAYLIKLLSKYLGSQQTDIIGRLENNEYQPQTDMNSYYSQSDGNSYYSQSDGNSYYSQQDNPMYRHPANNNPFIKYAIDAANARESRRQTISTIFRRFLR